MDMVGHHELPSSHINPATASLEDCEYAIALDNFSIAYYTAFTEELEDLIRAKLNGAGSSGTM